MLGLFVVQIHLQKLEQNLSLGLEFCEKEFSRFSQIFFHERNWHKKAEQFGKTYILESEYDQSRIIDIRPKPKFSFSKIRPSAEGMILPSELLHQP